MQNSFRGGGGGWDSHGKYMSDKSNKLREQYNQTYTVKSDLFQGLTFWQTGRSFEIDVKKLVSEHGGIYEQYGLRKVTHIIAQTVATSNQQWRALLHGGLNKRTFKIAKPQWILDSIKEGRKLNETDYLPEGLEGNALFNLRTSKKRLNQADTTSTIFTKDTSISPTSVCKIGRRVGDLVSDVLEICQELVAKDLHVTYVQVTLLLADWSQIVRSLKPTVSVLEGLHEVVTAIDAKSSVVELTVSCFASPFAPAIAIFPTVSPVQRLETLMLRLGDSGDFQQSLAEISAEGGEFAMRAAAIDALQSLAENRKFDKVRKLLLAVKNTSGSEAIVKKGMEIFSSYYRGGKLKL
jgi:hypothetical protein